MCLDILKIHLMFKILFKQDVQATVNLRYITSGSLKTSGRKFKPKSGQIRLSLRVGDQGWQPRIGFHKWNSTLRTFTEVNSISTSTSMPIQKKVFLADT